MKSLYICAFILTLAAVLSVGNRRWFNLPNNIALMVMSALIAAILAVFEWHGFTFVKTISTHMIKEIDLNDVVIDGFLCLLLFVGAMHVALSSLWSVRVPILFLATFGVLVSAVTVGTLFYCIAWLLGLSIPYLYCLAFGALISPTDAVMVLSFLRGVGLSPEVESKITGESLFNDGMSIVLFGTFVSLARGTADMSLSGLAMLPVAMVYDIIFAALVGVTTGVLASGLLYLDRKHKHFYSAFVVTLALATGSFAAADALGASGPIAAVAAGLWIGNSKEVMGRDYGGKHSLSDFWDVIDEVLNAVLFVIIGLELLAVSTVHAHLLLAVLAIPVVILARYAAIYGTWSILGSGYSFNRETNYILTWGGLRGGISIALALSLPAGEVRDILMTATYAVVVFSIIVMGPTLPRLVSALKRS